MIRTLAPLAVLVLATLASACAAPEGSVDTDETNELNTRKGTFQYRVGTANEAHFDGSSPPGGNGVRASGDGQGWVRIDLSAGPHTVQFARRSSHSIDTTETFSFTIVGGQVNEPDLGDVIFTRPEITACSDDDSMGPGDQTAVVTMFVNSFTPFTTTIKVGGSVEFDFGADPHNVIFDRITGAPADIQQTVNRKVSRTFTVAGKFPYECRLHPGMNGEVVVTP